MIRHSSKVKSREEKKFLTFFTGNVKLESFFGVFCLASSRSKRFSARAFFVRKIQNREGFEGKPKLFREITVFLIFNFQSLSHTLFHYAYLRGNILMFF